MSYRSVFACVFAIYFVLGAVVPFARAQRPFDELPDGEHSFGEFTVGNLWSEGELPTYQWTKKRVFRWEEGVFKYYSSAYVAPLGREILKVVPKRTHVPGPGFLVAVRDVFILLDDYSVVKLTFESHDPYLPKSAEQYAQFKSTDRVISLVVDDAYLLQPRAVWVTRDDGKSWVVDTTGLGNATNSDVVLDSNNNIYLASSAGIFQQGPTESAWHRLSALATSFLTIDRDDHLLAQFSTGLQISSDRGSTWSSFNIGLPQNGQIFSVAEDKHGIHYAAINDFASGDHIYRHTTSGWVAADSTLTSVNPDPFDFTFLTGVSADSIVRAFTKYGTFASVDGGTTWNTHTSGLRAENIYGLYRSSNETLAITSLGIYYKGKDDAAFRKTYPTAGYQAGPKLWIDNAGKFYTVGPDRKISFQSIPGAVYISNDRGASWQADSVGLSAFRAGTFFVDENGNQYLASYEGSQNMPATRVKHPGGSWATLDMTVASIEKGDLPNYFASNGRGSLFLSTSNYTTNKRRLLVSTNGGSWSEIQNGAGNIGVLNYAGTLDGKTIAGSTFGGIELLTNGTWQSLPFPNGIANDASAYAFSVDSSNNLFVSFGTTDSYSHYTPTAVYATSDLGQHWMKIGLDSLNIGKMVSYGDSTYALTNDGVYVMTFPAGESVSLSPATHAVKIWPNPGTSTISLDLTSRDAVVVTISDVLGRMVLRKALAAVDQPLLDVSSLPAGTYSCKIMSSKGESVLKLVINGR